ncbi:MAG: PQQ-binding-like beta-propeller repeat protein [Verrucomicrobiota bacterium]
MKYSLAYHLTGLLTVATALSATAGNWPQWRGPHFNGSADEKDLPSTWSKETALWSVDLPGPSAATPVIWGDHVFVSTADENSQTLYAVCFDRTTGKKLWNNKVSDGIRRDEQSNFSAPSPVADADRVFFFYSNGGLVAFDHSGKELWLRNITKDYGDFAFQWTFSSSPLLYGGKLYLQVLQRNVPVHGRGRSDGPIESFILAIDPVTGKTLWRHVRASEAVAESLEAYSTPIPFEYQGRKEILIAGGDCLTGHDPETGKELWRWGTWNPTKIGHWRLVPSPVAGGGVVLACAPKRDLVYAIKAGGNGGLNGSAVVWKSDQKRELTADVPTPLFYDGDFFVLSDVRKNLSRVDPATGNVKWTVELPGNQKFEASPTGADGKLYLMNFGADVVVMDAAKGGILGTIAMGEQGDDQTRSSIAVANGQLFIRTNHKLYCIARK